MAAKAAGNSSDVNAQDIWDELIRQGASSTEAAGIMGNMMNESGLNVETGAGGTAIDSNGYPVYGLVSWNTAPGDYPGAASLVTGNPKKDLVSQIKFLAKTGGFRAASGSTPAEAGGNFAANYERCQGCQQGGSQYLSRSANAVQMFSASKTGKWPQAATDTSTAGGGGSGGSGGGKTATCLVDFPSINLHVTSIGGGCLLSKTQARAMIAAGLITVSGLVALTGFIIMAAWGFQKTGALGTAAKAAAVVPGGQPVAAGLATAQARSARAPRQRPPAKPKAPKTSGGGSSAPPPASGQQGGTQARSGGRTQQGAPRPPSKPAAGSRRPPARRPQTTGKRGP